LKRKFDQGSSEDETVVEMAEPRVEVKALDVRDIRKLYERLRCSHLLLLISPDSYVLSHAQETLLTTNENEFIANDHAEVRDCASPFLLLLP